MVRLWTSAAAITSLALFSGAASAQPIAPPLQIASAPASTSDCAKEIEATETQAAKDRTAVMEVAKAAQTGGMPAVNGRLEQLIGIVDHMPAREITQCDGKTYMRGMGPTDLLAALVGSKGQAKPQIVVLGASPYPLAARLLGSAYLDRGDFVKADAAMKKGLALSPADPFLANEEALTLAKLHRPAEGLAVVQRAIDADALAPKPIQARLLRTKGYNLGDLGRYDEAIVAYQDSLKLEPENGLAKNEIGYLTKRKGGAPVAPAVTMTGDQSKSLVPQP